MKPYLIEITTHAVVMAEDEDHARSVADSYKREAFGDDPNPRIEVECEVAKLQDLEHGWDGECIPYGGDGNTRLAELLPPNPELSCRRFSPVSSDDVLGRHNQELK